ncbi:MAG: hypothetical protein GWN58_35320 [Anaerolineae bacterium]|nr:hypothetical protein [Anaerolineae bacterium]
MATLERVEGEELERLTVQILEERKELLWACRAVIAYLEDPYPGGREYIIAFLKEVTDGCV